MTQLNPMVNRRAPAMKTRVSDLLGTPYPIVQGGMQWVGHAELAAAVSNAGALGILTALTQPTPQALADEIIRCRSLTDRPFGVNITMFPSIKPRPYAEYVDAAAANGVKIIETAGNKSADFWPQIKAAGMKIIHKCVAVRHALSAERLGVDAISIDGFECAGHPGEEDVPGLVLIPLAVNALKIPVIASGGIADGRGMAAAMALGAEGINMGTRFQVTKESPIHDNIKQALVSANERDTRLIFRTLRNTARVWRNEVADAVVAKEKAGCSFEDIRDLVAGERGKAALRSGDLHGGVISAGMVIGLIHDIPSCDDLIQRMVFDCRERVSAVQATFAAP